MGTKVNKYRHLSPNDPVVQALVEACAPKKKEIPPVSEWSVTKYGVQLVINSLVLPQFSDGVSLDVEDNEQSDFIGIGIFDGKTCYYWSDWELAKQLTIPKFVAHNGRTDLEKLRKWGFKVDESWLLHDTQLFEHILDSSKKTYGLKALVELYFNHKYPSYEDLTGKKGTKNHVTLDKLDPTLVAEYNANDTYWTHRLYERQWEYKFQENVDYFDQVEKPAAFVFQAMEQKGIRIDVPYLTELEKDLSNQRASIEKEIKNDLGDINLNSPKQLLEALHAKEIKPKFKNKHSTDKRALASLKDNPIVGRLLKYSELETLLSSFVRPYLERNQEVVHPQYLQCGTRTGRPACKDPNLLQIPGKTENGKLVRRMFIPRDGYLFGDCDFGQIEPRVLAHLSKDKVLLEMFNSGTDFHTFTSEQLAISRDRAKVLNLSVGYRATFKSVAHQLKCSDFEAQEAINKWWSQFPELWDWQQKLIHDTKKTGYFTTLIGRRIQVDGLSEYNKFKREHAERQLINNIIQGSAAEIMKLGMIKAHKEGINLILQVYDELLCEEKEEDIEAAMNVLIDCMRNAVQLDVPLEVDGKIGKSWDQVH